MLKLTQLSTIGSLQLPANMANPINKAAWQKTFKGRPFVIEEAPMPSATPDQIIIKTRAIGINPADAAVQNLGMVYDASKHPLILGLDVAGEVYAVGSNITQFRPGDRVCGYSVDMTPEIESQRGSFQLYCAVKAGLVGKIPDNVSFSEASVFPSCLSVAAYSMFLKDTMGLQLPPLNGSADSNEQVLVVWGGSSVVGSCAVQMARLAGYEVIATASEMNFEHCRELGAAQVYDYKSCSAVEDIVAACREKVFAGVLVAYFNNDSTIAASKIAAQLSGNKIVGTVVPQHMAVPEGVAEGVNITASKCNPNVKCRKKSNANDLP